MTEKLSSSTFLKWRLSEVNETSLGDLRDSGLHSEVPDLVLKILSQRGIGNEDVGKKFLDPKLAELKDPFLLPNMELAVGKIFDAIDSKKRILLFGDYDVDGVTSVALMKITLEAYEGSVSTRLPDRKEDGYGLSVSALEQCIAQYDPELVIAIDCGTNDLEAAEFLKKKGIDLIVLDHHEVLDSQSLESNSGIIVNANLGDDFGYLCSIGVVFKVAHAMIKKRGGVDGFDLKNYTDLVAVGTISDMVPLVDENRILVRKGLGQLANTENLGLAALKEISGCPNRVASSQVSFRMGPRINASGRVDNATHSLNLMLADESGEAKELAMKLDEFNRRRQEVERKIFEEIEEELEKEEVVRENSIVLGKRGWNPGIVGIVASRVMRKLGRPAIVIGFDEEGVGKGSGRSVKGVNLVSALDESRDLLISGGGHEQAVGVTINENKLSEFRESFEMAVAKQSVNNELVPELEVDQLTSFKEVDYEFLSYYEMLEPFGVGNKTPVFQTNNVKPFAEPRYIGSDCKHLKLKLEEDGEVRDAIWFNAPENLPDAPWDIVYTIERNEFRGNSTLQLQLQDMRSSNC